MLRSELRCLRLASDLRTGEVRTIDHAGAEAPWIVTAIPLLNGYQWSEYFFYTADFEPGSTVQVGGERSAPIDGQRVAIPGQTIDIRTWRGNTIGRHVILDDAGGPIGREGVGNLHASPIIASALEPFFVAAPGE